MKKSSVLDSLRPKTCPGVPSGAPPPLSDYETFEVEAKTDSENRSKRIRFAGQENSGDATNTTAGIDVLQCQLNWITIFKN